MKSFVMGVASACLIALAGASSAATIDFETDSNPGHPFEQAGFQVTQVGGGNVSTPNNCGSACLLLQNGSSGKTYKLSQIGGGAFNLLSFSFNGTDAKGQNAGNPVDALFASLTTSGGTVFTDTVNGNVMTSTGPLSQFMGVTAVYFFNAGNGSARVDDIKVEAVSAVPVPAAGYMLLAGLGAFAAFRRRKS